MEMLGLKRAISRPLKKWFPEIERLKWWSPDLNFNLLDFGLYKPMFVEL